MQSQKQCTFPEVKKEHNAFDDIGSSSDTTGASQDSSNNSLDEISQGWTYDASSDEHDDNIQSSENASNQIVVYNPENSNAGQVLSIYNPSEHVTLPKFAASDHSTRVLPSVGEFACQCATCFKWRLIPTKEKYEAIRQYIKEEPFVCETAREWRPDISCDDPADISQDGTRLWAIDKPSISQPPAGWKRSVRIRGEGGTRFADVYYTTPTGKTLRSKVEIQKYLLEHPEFIRAGINLSQFSFLTPKPLREGYVKKRTYKKAMKQKDATALEMLGPHEPAEVSPIAWAGPVQGSDLPISTRQDSSSAPCLEAPILNPDTPPAKKRAIKHPSKRKGNPLHEPKVEESRQARDGANEV